MKKNVVILLFSLASLTLSAKPKEGEKVDPAIEARFKQDFGTNLNASWKVIDDIAIATYNEQGVQKEAYYFTDGEIFGLGKTIEKDLLPANIGRAIDKRFGVCVIQTVYEFRTPTSPTRYFVRLVTPRRMMVVSANEFGEIAVSQKQKAK